MGLRPGHGLLIAEQDEGLAEHCRTLLEHYEVAQKHSACARRQVEERFSLDATYGHLAQELGAFIGKREVK